jgi:hypothetical protein
MSAARLEALRSKRVQRGRISVVVEQSDSLPVPVFFALNSFTTVLDTFIYASHTAHTPFQILLSECADAHPCRGR